MPDSFKNIEKWSWSEITLAFASNIAERYTNVATSGVSTFPLSDDLVPSKLEYINLIVTFHLLYKYKNLQKSKRKNMDIYFRYGSERIWAFIRAESEIFT